MSTTRPWRPARRRSVIRPAYRRRPEVPDRDDDPVDWPLSECLLSRGWQHDGPITVVWIRRHPLEPRYASAVVRAHLGTGGIEEITELVDVGPAATWSAIEEARSDGPLERVDPKIAVQLLERTGQRSPLIRDRRAPFATFSLLRQVDA